MSPALGLCQSDPKAVEPLAHVITSASSGLELVVGPDVRGVLTRAPGGLMLLVADAAQVLGAVADLVQDGVRLIVIADEIDLALLTAATRLPRLLGVVGRTDGQIRTWELAYLVRRAVSPQTPPPGSHELLSWGASSVTFRPRSSAERDQTVQAIETVSIRFGLSRRTAVMAADATHELLMNAMYDAPHDARGQPRYANDRQANITLAEAEIPTLRLTVDSQYLALDASDPFGRLARSKLFGGLLRAATGSSSSSPTSLLDVSHGGAGLGLFKLFSTCTFLRAEVTPGRQTLVSWLVDRSLGGKTQRSAGRSVAYIELPDGAR